MREMRALAASLVLLSTTVFAVGLPGHPVGHIIASAILERLDEIKMYLVDENGEAVTDSSAFPPCSRISYDANTNILSWWGPALDEASMTLDTSKCPVDPKTSKKLIAFTQDRKLICGTLVSTPAQ